MVTPRTSTTALNNISSTGQNNMNARPAKSCESLYSNSSKGSANMVYGRKVPMDNKSGSMRQPAIIPATNEVRQRVLSARRLRMKTYQNQLANAQQTIAELAHENRILRTLHKRQDSALSKYESTNAELPQLLHSHAEELRVWQTKYRNLQAANKELEQKLKQKESIILSLSDQNKYYIQLNKDKNLDDRQKLTEKLQSLETRLQEKENDIKMMARKMQLESKQAKQQLQLEQKKTKDVLMKLEKARLELSGFRKLEELQQLEVRNEQLITKPNSFQQLQDKFNLNIRRHHKPSISDDNNKDNKDLEKITTAYSVTDADADANADDTDATNSHRSNHSNNTVTQRSNRTIKKLVNPSTTNERLSPSRANARPSTKLPGSGKSIAVLRRIDQGDGDAGKISMAQQNHSNALPSLEQRKSENPSTEYEDDYENDDDDGDADYHEDDEDQDTEDDLVAGESQDVLGEGGRFLSNIDSVTVEKGLYEENIDYYQGTTKIELPNAGKKIRMKEEISSIRKQISDDYKEREAFLDTFCRQATAGGGGGALKEDTPKKRNSIAVAAEHSVPSSRKHKLLAALKAIDDNKSQD